MTEKKSRKIHTQEFKQEAVNFASKQGGSKTAKALDVYESQIVTAPTPHPGYYH